MEISHYHAEISYRLKTNCCKPTSCWVWHLYNPLSYLLSNFSCWAVKFMFWFRCTYSWLCWIFMQLISSILYWVPCEGMLPKMQPIMWDPIIVCDNKLFFLSFFFLFTFSLLYVMFFSVGSSRSLWHLPEVFPPMFL